MPVFDILIGCIALGSAVYCVLTVIAARKYLAVAPPPLSPPGPVSVLKPLAGAEDDLYSNLRTFLQQDYPDFEVLFAVRQPDDPAVKVVDRLRAEFPRIPARLIVTGEPPYPNAKVYSLDRMMAAATHELLVMSDSDIRVTPGFLRIVAAEFSDPKAGLSTCLYRAVPGRGIWAMLEAIGMNTQFAGGVLTARMLEGMRFALGPTITARKTVLREMGGFDRLKDYLAEDFVMGKFAAENGHLVILSSYVIEHHIGGGDWKKNLGHRLRWVRSTRRSRPAGYVGEMFTMPLPWALLMLAVWWPGAIALLVLRALSALACAGWVLHDPLTARRWYLVPLQDVLAFAMWVAGFFGNKIWWRGRRYLLKPDGTFEPIAK